MVVVVVVTVFVSTHSATACILDIASPSSHPMETVWLVRGRRVSVPLCKGFEVEVKGLGDPSDVYLEFTRPGASIVTARCVYFHETRKRRSQLLCPSRPVTRP